MNAIWFWAPLLSERWCNQNHQGWYKYLIVKHFSVFSWKNYKRFINVCGMKWLEEHNSWFFILDFRISPFFQWFPNVIFPFDQQSWIEIDEHWASRLSSHFVRFLCNIFWDFMEINFDISSKYILRSHWNISWHSVSYCEINLPIISPGP